MPTKVWVSLTLISQIWNQLVGGPGSVSHPNCYCLHCGNATYRNPLPVSVILLPVDDGLLLVRRINAPQAGKLALPGGFIEVGETWQEAGAREVREETGFTVEAGSIRLFDALSAPDGTLLVFGLAPPFLSRDLPPFVPSSETSEMAVTRGPLELAFSTHTEVVARYWKERFEDGKTSA